MGGRSLQCQGESEVKFTRLMLRNSSRGRKRIIIALNDSNINAVKGVKGLQDSRSSISLTPALHHTSRSLIILLEREHTECVIHSGPTRGETLIRSTHSDPLITNTKVTNVLLLQLLRCRETLDASRLVLTQILCD